MLSNLSIVTGSAAFLPLATAFAASRLPLPSYIAVPVTAGLMQASACGFAVAIAASTRMCQRTTRMLAKNHKTGKFPWYSWLIFWPYHIALRVLVRLKLIKNSRVEPLWTHIKDDWYIGGWPVSKSELPDPDMAVLDCTCELPTVADPERYFTIGVWDTTAPTDSQITAAVDWALQQKQRGRAVMVHCAHGHGRSCVVLCALLVACGLATKGYWEAFSMIKAKRPKVRLNDHQRPGLDAWYRRHVVADKGLVKELKMQ